MFLYLLYLLYSTNFVFVREANQKGLLLLPPCCREILQLLLQMELSAAHFPPVLFWLQMLFLIWNSSGQWESTNVHSIKGIYIPVNERSSEAASKIILNSILQTTPSSSSHWLEKGEIEGGVRVPWEDYKKN